MVGSGFDRGKTNKYCVNNFFFFKAVAGVAQWTEHGPANQSVAGLILSQGTCLDCRLGAQ